MNNYKYIGDGAGVPGLPHEIPEGEAAQYGDALKDAIDAGVYELESSIALSEDEAQSPRRSKAPETAEGETS